MKNNRNEMGINRPAGIPLPRPVESFAGRRCIASGVDVENPALPWGYLRGAAKPDMRLLEIIAKCPTQPNP